MLRRDALGVAALAAATLLLESSLTRLLAVAQFYHFAFLAVSLALLGCGASGTLLSVAPRLARLPPGRVLARCGLGFAAASAIAYATINFLPFDSYSIAWERRQLLFFALYYLALMLPFLAGGLGIAAVLAAAPPGRSHLAYAANLLGSAAGALLAPALLGLAGVPAAVLGSVLIALLPAVLAGREPAPAGTAGDVSPEGERSTLSGLESQPARPRATSRRGEAESHPSTGGWPRRRLARQPAQDADLSQPRAASSRRALRLSVLLLAPGLAALAVLAALNLSGRGPLGMILSPYKGLSYARRLPGFQELFGQWNAVSRLDLAAGSATHLLPGLSYAFDGLPPEQYGLSVDGDSLQPVSLVSPAAFSAADWLPEAVAFVLRPGADVLVLEPGGGLGLLQAAAGGARRITAVAANPLLLRAVAASAGVYDPYADPRVTVSCRSPRVQLRVDPARYDLVYLPLTDAYRPVASGAYSLAETYTLTVEAFADALDHLTADGMLVVTRWLQTPPSEDLRLLAGIVEALSARGEAEPGRTLVAYRGIQTITVLVQPAGWADAELGRVREFAAARRYDLVWAPDVREDEVNRINRLPSAAHYLALRDLLASADRSAFYAAYPYAVAPVTDDQPFFFHFFRWGQARQVMATLGRTWQPFGGSGFLVLFALLALVLVLSIVLIALPLAVRRRDCSGGAPRRAGAARPLLYFGLLGLAFLFVEIPLIQRWMLAFGHAVYAFTVVVAALLLGSGLGSLLAMRWAGAGAARLRVWAPLVLIVVAEAWLGRMLVDAALGWPPVLQVVGALASLLPLGVLMGMPFPLGLAWLEREHGGSGGGLVAWAWAVNGCTSVIASVLAALAALSAGLTAVMLLGAGAYAAAAVCFAERRRDT